MAPTHTETVAPSSSRTGPALTRRPSSAHSRQKRAWESRRASFRSGPSRPQIDPQQEEPLSRQGSHRATAYSSKRQTPTWWKIRLFKGMIGDIKRRAPYYWSDWKDAWDYRVVPATVYMYFAKYGIRNLSMPHRSSFLSFVQIGIIMLPRVPVSLEIASRVTIERWLTTSKCPSLSFPPKQMCMSRWS